MNEATTNKGGQKAKNTSYPKLPSEQDYIKAIEALYIIRDFYAYDYEKNRAEKPDSLYGKKAKIVQTTINLLPSNLRHNYEENRR